MANILISPSKYVQGSGEINHLNHYMEPFGKRALAIISSSGYKRIGADIEQGFEKGTSTISFEFFHGECSKKEVNRILEIAEEKSCDVIVGIGGGKILDVAKAVAFYKKVPVIICPTIASTDAPCSALAVLYTEDGIFDEYLTFPTNPDLVLMDTLIVSKSPARLTIAGMGDALATYFEARAVKRKDAGTIAGGRATLAASALAKLCYDTLMEEGVNAKLALEAGVCTTSVEKIIEANTLLSGIGFESGGLAAAHAIHNGLTVLKECHSMYHGEKVAFGTLAQLVLENAPNEEIEEVIDFCVEVGLPITLKELGVNEISNDKIMEVAKAACGQGETIHNMPFEVTVEKVYAAILAADAMGRYYLGEG